jgi:signal peptidase I
MFTKAVRFLVKALLIIFGVLILAAVIFYGGLVLARDGKIKIPVWVTVDGTSMQPTLQNNERVKFDLYFSKLAIHRGDVVVFSNSKTTDDNGAQVSYVKRVIGLPGETVMLQDGFIEVNGQVVNEPYIKAKKTTYSESFTPECQKLVVPSDSYFVLGDNRADSKDSRDFGFVKKTDVRYIIYYQSQITMSAFQVSLTSQQIINQINSERAAKNLTLLKENSKLDQATASRAQSIAKYNDWTTAASKSNFSYTQALSQAGYSNTITAEIFDGSYLNITDLTLSWHQNQNLMNIYLNPKFQDIGASLVMGNLNDCKVPVISVIFGGYEAPNYDASTINSWQSTLNNLKKIQPSWQNLVNEPQVYNNQKAQVDQINQIISERITRISSALTTMKDNQWLSDQQKNWLSGDPGLATAQNNLADEINNFVKGL